MKEYKVLTRKDFTFWGKFDPKEIERKVNQLAEKGWEIISIATTTIESKTGYNEEILVVMGRDAVKEPEPE